MFVLGGAEAERRCITAAVFGLAANKPTRQNPQRQAHICIMSRTRPELGERETETETEREKDRERGP